MEIKVGGTKLVTKMWKEEQIPDDCSKRKQITVSKL